jgi:hypothetical protein
VTRDRNFGIFEMRAQVGLRTPDHPEKGGASSHPGLVVGTTGGGSLFRPATDAVLRDEASSWTSPDISSGHPCCSDRKEADIEPTRCTRPALRVTQDRVMGLYQRWIIPGAAKSGANRALGSRGYSSSAIASKTATAP